MKKNKINSSLFIGLVVTVFLISVMSVSAATTIISPAASSGINGSVLFNITNTDLILIDNDNVTLLNITIWAKSSLTANSSWVVIGENSSLNVSGELCEDLDDSGCNMTTITIDVTNVLEDANNYIINASAYNMTATGGLFSDDTNTGIIVDNTIPTASTSLTPTTDADGSVTFSGTVDGTKTTSCNLVFANNGPTFGSRTQSMTHTGDTCSLSLTGIPEHTYIWYIDASDESNVTSSSTQTTNVDISTGGGYNPPLGITGDVIDAGGVPIALIILVVVIVAIVWLVCRK